MVSGREFAWDEGGRQMHVNPTCGPCGGFRLWRWMWWLVGLNWAGVRWSGGPAGVVSGMPMRRSCAVHVDDCCVCGAVVGEGSGVNSWGLERGLDGRCLQRRG